MPSESHLIVSTWKEIAEYTPFTWETLRKRFGKEMLHLGVVFKSRQPGSRCRRPVIWGSVWKIERYIHLKAEKGELYQYDGKRNPPPA